MKSEFDLNNLTDEDVRILEEALSRRRILKICIPDGYSLINQAFPLDSNRTRYVQSLLRIIEISIEACSQSSDNLVNLV